MGSLLMFALLMLVSSALAQTEVRLLHVAELDLIGDQKDPNFTLPKFFGIFRSMTSDGFQCQSPCILRRGIFQCHNLEEGWRFCSPSENHAYNGRPCEDNSPCKFRIDHYATCTTIDGERLQCGMKDDQDGPLLTGAYNSFCTDQCRGSKFTWCHSTHPQGWDYCSLADQQTTTVGVKCNPGAACAFGPRDFRACEVGTSVHERFWHCSDTKGKIFNRIDGKITALDPAPAPAPPTHPILRPGRIPVRRPVIRWTAHNAEPVGPLTYSDIRNVWTLVSSSGK